MKLMCSLLSALNKVDQDIKRDANIPKTHMRKPRQGISPIKKISPNNKPNYKTSKVKTQKQYNVKKIERSR